MTIKKSHLFTVLAAAGLLSIGVLGLSGCSKSGTESSNTGAPGVPPQSAVQQPPQAASNVISDLKMRLNERPDDPEVLRALADAYFEVKQFNEAIIYYKKALEKRPGDADIYNELGLSLHYTNNSREAVRYLDEGIKQNPYHQRIWLTKGFILAYGMGDLDAARSAWEKANALNPESQIGKAAGEYLAMFKKQKQR